MEVSLPTRTCQCVWVSRASDWEETTAIGLAMLAAAHQCGRFEEKAVGWGQQKLRLFLYLIA